MSKEHAYAYEAGYRDGSIHYELEHCPACKNVVDLQEALAENAKLRKLVDGFTWCCGHHCGTGGPTMTSATEQAIAATLGSCNVGRYVGLRQGEYWERTENSNYYCGGCGWKVTDHDSYCPECGGALHEYALGTETCHITDNGPWGYPYVCSACGASFDPDVNNGEFNYCPNCGARCVW